MNNIMRADQSHLARVKVFQHLPFNCVALYDLNSESRHQNTDQLPHAGYQAIRWNPIHQLALCAPTSAVFSVDGYNDLSLTQILGISEEFVGKIESKRGASTPMESYFEARHPPNPHSHPLYHEPSSPLNSLGSLAPEVYHQSSQSQQFVASNFLDDQLRLRDRSHISMDQLSGQQELSRRSKYLKRMYQVFSNEIIDPTGENAESVASDYDGDDKNSDSDHGKDSASAGKKPKRFRSYQKGQWSTKYEELVDYCKRHGNCLVQYTYRENVALARWVKRQRYQYKLMLEGKPSTMTHERVELLERIGFVWDSQGASWYERLAELEEFKNRNGHCNVPSHYGKNSRLAAWVKCQRRQYKLFQEGKPSNMSQGRIDELENLGFSWELRIFKNGKKQKRL